MKRNASIVVLGLLAIASSFFLTPRAEAATPDQPCVSRERLDALASLSHDPNDQNSIETELTARKDLLRATIDCALTEARGLRNGIRSLSAVTANADADALRARYLERMDELVSYYEFQRTRIPDLGLWASREFARDLKGWRRSTYAPTANASLGFILWSKNQLLFKTAENRLDQVTQTVTLLKLTDDETIEKKFADATSKLGEAKAANSAAWDALVTFGTTTDPVPSVKSSLESLSSVYQNLFEISQSVKTLLPRS